jgi:hypothetical protein
MRRVLLIFISLILSLVSWSPVNAEDAFYVIPTMKRNYAPVPKTGQTTPYAAGDDGTLRKGVAWPNPRFIDNRNGTVIDKLTGLIWMQDAGYFEPRSWVNALIAANNLQSGMAGITDGSKAGDWRLPNFRELQSLVDYGAYGPALQAGHPFVGVQTNYYWSSTTAAFNGSSALSIYFSEGGLSDTPKITLPCQVWCVRGGP